MRVKKGENEKGWKSVFVGFQELVFRDQRQPGRGQEVGHHRDGQQDGELIKFMFAIAQASEIHLQGSKTAT